VDYILFLTADVTVIPNKNEIQDFKYVDKAELQAMFNDSCAYVHCDLWDASLLGGDSKFFHALVQVDCSRLFVWVVGYTYGAPGL
jgi:hypothetical protein